MYIIIWIRHNGHALKMYVFWPYSSDKYFPPLNKLCCTGIKGKSNMNLFIPSYVSNIKS